MTTINSLWSILEAECTREGHSPQEGRSNNLSRQHTGLHGAQLLAPGEGACMVDHHASPRRPCLTSELSVQEQFSLEIEAPVASLVAGTDLKAPKPPLPGGTEVQAPWESPNAADDIALKTYTTMWEGPQVAPGFPPVLGAMGTPNFLGTADAALQIAFYTYQALEIVVGQMERIRWQWWTDPVSNASHWLGSYSYVRLLQLRNGFGRAVAQLVGGAYDDKEYLPIWRHTETYSTCAKETFDCEVDTDTGRVTVCPDWDSLAPAVRLTSLLAALVTGPNCTNKAGSSGLIDPGEVEGPQDQALLFKNAYNWAEWAIERWATWNTQVTGDTHPAYWDGRPMLTFRRQFPLTNGFHMQKGDSEYETQLINAWRAVYWWVEAAFRFIYRLSIYAAQGDLDAIATMWRFGGTASDTPVTPVNATWYKHPFAWPDRRFYHPADPADLSVKYGSLYPVSMEAWFGPYTPRRLLTVAKVVLRLLGRFQEGGYWRENYFYAEPALVGRPWTEITGKFQQHLTLQWLEKSRLGQGLTLCHEMMHFLVRESKGGRPRDWDSAVCSTEGTVNPWKCYGYENALALAQHDPSRAVGNIDNYRGWMYWRYYRWDGGWPVSADTTQAFQGLWAPDPISDDDWQEVGTWSLDTANDWYDHFAEDLGESGYSPWDW